MDNPVLALSSKVDSLLFGTRAVKSFIKGAYKAHQKLENSYSKLITASALTKSQSFKEIFESHIAYTKSFLSFNDEIIRSTRVAYDSLKRLAFEVKSTLSLLKIEKKNLNRIKKDNQESQISVLTDRCSTLVRNITETVNTRVKEAINSHLSSLKHVKTSTIALIPNENFSEILEKSEIMQKSHSRSIDRSKNNKWHLQSTSVIEGKRLEYGSRLKK